MYRYRVPGVLESLRWLFGDRRLPESGLIRFARMKGLLDGYGDGKHWTCDGAMLARLVEACIRVRVPDHGAVLVGIGEMMARAHDSEARVEAALGRIFHGSVPEPVRSRIFREAVEFYGDSKAKMRRGSVSVYTPHSLSIMDWNQIDLAATLIQSPQLYRGAALWGVRLVARLCMKTAPERLRFLAREADYQEALPAVVAAVVDTCRWDGDASQSLLRSGVPAFISLGVACLRDGGEDGKGWKASRLDDALRDSGVPPHGRRRLSAFVLKEAVHAWYRQKDRLAENKRRQVLLRLEPSRATGGERYAADEMARLKREEPELGWRRVAVHASLEDALTTAASHGCDPADVWNIYEPSFVDTAEIRHRFAMLHPAGNSRIAALKKALDAFDRVVGIRRPAEAFREMLDVAGRRNDLAWWAANTQIALSAERGTDAGHDTARHIAGLEQAARELALQPLASSRFGDRFQGALARWSVVLQFAFAVALTAPAAPLVRLRDLALESARKFLPVSNEFSYDIGNVDSVIKLTSDAICSCDEAVMNDWIGDSHQPMSLHARIIWENPIILSRNRLIARSLIDRIMSRPSGRRMSSRNAVDLVDILDRFAATSLNHCDDETRADLRYLYAAAASYTDNPLTRSIDVETIISSVAGERDAANSLLNDPIWNTGRLAMVVSSRR